jgi:hypothetical protein
MATLSRLLIPLLAGISVGVTPHVWSQTGIVISGRVYDADTNKPLTGVRVSTLYGPFGAEKPEPVMAKSSEDGTFTLAVAPGRHVVCADAGRAYLDPCQWARGTVTIDITRSAVLDLPLRRGVLLIIRLHDPSAAAQAARNANPALAKVPAPPLSAILTEDSGAARPIPFVSTAGTSSEFSVLVPEETRFQLSIASSLLALADTSGNPLAQNAFRTSLTSPALSANSVERSPLGRPIGPNIPSRVFNVVATGLVSQ